MWWQLQKKNDNGPEHPNIDAIWYVGAYTS